MSKPLPEWAKLAQKKWSFRGQERPPFAYIPQPGQESVWDYPRPPRIEPDHRRLIIVAQGKRIIDCSFSYRILETASPPTFYIPPEEFHSTGLIPYSQSSACEWKGNAQYWSIDDGSIHLEGVAWSYPTPFSGYEPIAGFLSFYPHRVECSLDGVRVRPQPGNLYGGWVTPEVVGPFKGEPGTELW